VADLITAKITWAWPKIKGDAAPYKAMEEFMKYILVYFIQVFILQYGGFKVLKILARGVLFNPLMLAAISIHVHAPMRIPLINARSIIPKSNKHN
jgi:hypothetical protein